MNRNLNLLPNLVQLLHIRNIIWTVHMNQLSYALFPVARDIKNIFLITDHLWSTTIPYFHVMKPKHGTLLCSWHWLFTICTDYTGYCPDTCSGLYNPLCGRDGKIYLNRCQLLLKICKTNNDWLFAVTSNYCLDGMFNNYSYWYNLSLEMDLNDKMDQNDKTFTLDALSILYIVGLFKHIHVHFHAEFKYDNKNCNFKSLWENVG